MKELSELLKEKEFTICSAESLTAGLFCSRMAEIPHVSAVLKGGIVTYWNEIKQFAGVNADTLEKYGAVSSQTAFEMALGVKEKFNTDVAVSFTGNAGPTVMENKEAGLVYTTIIIKNCIYGFKDIIKADRNEVREQIVSITVERLKDILRKNIINS